MHSAWLVLAVLVYVSLDVGNPFMPGMMTFDVEDSLDARGADRLRAHDATTLSPALPVSELEGAARPTPVIELARAHTRATTPPPGPRARSSLLAPAPPAARSEDH